MKKIRFFTPLILLLALIFPPLFSFAAALPPKILIIGDSISSGYGLEGYPDIDTQSYGSVFAKNLGGNSSENYVNLSIDGETTSGLLWRLENSPSINASGYDAVIVSSGGNDLIDSLLPSFLSIISELSGTSYNDTDLLKKINLASEKFFASAKKTGEAVYNNLSQILSKLKEQNPIAYTGILSLYDPFDDVENSGLMRILDQSLIAPCIDLLNSYIKKAAEENGFEYIDISELFKGRANEFTNIKSLDIHPNAKGHAAIAERLTAEYRDFASKDVFLSVDNAPDDAKLARIVLGVATIAGTTLFGCSAVVISLGKHRIRLIQKK